MTPDGNEGVQWDRLHWVSKVARILGGAVTAAVILVAAFCACVLMLRWANIL